MTKYIFEKIIKTQTIYLTLDKHFGDQVEKEQMKNVVRDTIHHKLMDMVLDELDDEKKKVFLIDVSVEHKHESLLERLKDWIEDFEDKLHGRAKEAESELVKLIEVI